MRQKFDLPVLNRQKGVAQFARGKLCHADVSSPVFAQEKGLKGHNKTYFQSLFYHLSLLHTSQAISTQPQIEFWAWGPCLVVDQGLTKLLIKQHWTLLTAVPLLYFAVATAYTLGAAAVLVLPPYKAARLCLMRRTICSGLPDPHYVQCSTLPWPERPCPSHLPHSTLSHVCNVINFGMNVLFLMQVRQLFRYDYLFLLQMRSKV